jgi:hypothetical protein
VNTRPQRIRAEDSTEPADGRSDTTLGESMTLASVTHCDMNGEPLSSIERAIVAALVSAIVKELQGEPGPAEMPSA